MDDMKDLRTMAFASRLKRLGDRLKAEATKIYQSHGIDFNDSWFLVAIALSRTDKMTVSEMAGGLGITHAAISQMASAMEKKGLLQMSSDESDRRRTQLQLTDKGRTTINMLKPVWNLVGRCTDDLITETEGDFLQSISNIENALDNKSLFDRAETYTKNKQRPRSVD